MVRRDGSIEGLPMVGDEPTRPFCGRCGHHAEQHDPFRRCVSCQCRDFESEASHNPTAGLWSKRNTPSGHFTAVKRSGNVFKGVKREN